MRFFYLDASALAKRYTPEPGDVIVDHLFARLTPDRLLVLNIGIAEVVSIFVRKRNARVISQSSYIQAVANFRAEIINPPQLHKTAPDTSLITDALPLIDSHSINATDAVLLRAALDFADTLRARGDDLVLVASDQRLLRSAQAEGLTLFNPETQTTADLDLLV